MDRKKGGGCRFQSNVKGKLASHHSLRANLGHAEAWDLEDLVKAALEKIRFFFLIQPSGFFLFFLFFFYIFAQKRGVLGFFSVLKILLGASRL
jgi:hypothetical protein